MILKCPNCDTELRLMVTLTFVDVQAKGVVDEDGLAHFVFGNTGIRARDKVKSIYCPNPDCDWSHDDAWLFLNSEVKKNEQS